MYIHIYIYMYIKEKEGRGMKIGVQVTHKGFKSQKIMI